MTAHNFHPKYRSDIDGLRALAILPVVAYHAFPRYAPGGFIGVDIFFVISGYLISLIIFRSMLNNEFSFAEFYAHRIRRIFPALILVASACYAVGWFVLLPDEFKQLGKHIAAGMGFVQNFVLWGEAGYFDVASEQKPLMHVWSLAVEEQFYLIFPFLVWAVWRVRFNVLTVIVVLGAISFVLSQRGVGEDAVKAFFAPQTRFWELMAGSMLAYFYEFRARPPSFNSWIPVVGFNRLFSREVLAEKSYGLLSNILSFFGFALIVCSIAIYNHTVPYPGFRAVVPVLGAVLLILAGPEAYVNRQVLSRKIVVWVGLISYPLYLWHWPLLSFARIVETETPSPVIRTAAVVIGFILAALTYYLIEKRVRYGRSAWTKVAVLTLLGVLGGYIGYNTYSRNGLEFRVKEFQQITSAFNKIEGSNENCRSLFGGKYRGNCLLSHIGAPSVVLLGDSHAHTYYAPLRDALGATENVAFIGKGGCHAFAEIVRHPGIPEAAFDQAASDVCADIVNRIREDKLLGDAHTFILSSRDVAYMAGTGFAYDETVSQTERIAKFIISLRNKPTDNISQYDIWESAFREALEWFSKKGKNVIFLLDNPELGFNPKSCVNSRPFVLHNHAKEICAIPREVYERRAFKYRDLVKSVLKDYPSVKVLDASSLLCDQRWCWAMKDGKMLYRDGNHLSYDGASIIAKELVKLLQQAHAP